MKSVFGLDEKKAGMLSYVFGWISGIMVLILEKGNKNVRFHALQSTVFFGGVCVIQFILNILSHLFLIGIAAGFISWALGIIAFAAYVYLIYSTFKGIMFKLPIIGDIVWEQVNK